MRFLPLATAIALVLGGGSAQAAGSFIPLETMNGQATKFSQNGEYLSIFVSQAGGSRWTRATGVEEVLSGLNYVNGINNAGTISGSVPVNGGSTEEGGTDTPALSPIGASAPTELPLPSGMDNAGVYDVADDGSAVGLAWVSDWSASKAYYYSATQHAIVDLPVDAPDAGYRGNSISADGSVITGWNADPESGGWRGVVWKDLVPVYPTAVVDGDEYYVGEGSSVSGNGKWVVGNGYPSLTGSSAWRYKVDTGELTEIPGIPYAFGISDDGRTIVGASGFWDFPPRAAYIWTEDHGTQMMTDYLTARNIEFPADWGFSGGLTAISGDGTMAAGWTIGSPNGMQSYVVTGLDSPLDGIFANGFDGPQPVQDPSFEKTLGDAGPNPYWESGDTNPDNPEGTIFYSYFGGRTGGWSAVFGAHQNGGAETQYFSQSVEMLSPPSAYLNYWRYIGELPSAAGILTVSVDGTPVQTVDLSALPAPDDDFVPQSVDISDYADGGTHVIRFEFTFPGGASDGGTLIDDVTIDATGIAARGASDPRRPQVQSWILPKGR